MLMHPLLTAPPHPLQENHHCASAFKLMREDQYNWLGDMAPKSRETLRSQVRELCAALACCVQAG